MMRLTVYSRSDRPWLEVRTRRSLCRVVGVGPSELFVRAGAWLRQSGSHVIQVPAAEGVIGIGLDRSKESLALLRRYGGDFGRRGGWRSPFKHLPPVCHLGPDLVPEVDRREIETSLLRLLRSGKWRVVHLPELDVNGDDGVRVVQVVTSIQIGGAERIALDLARGLNQSGVETLLVALGSSLRPTFDVPPKFLDLSQEEDRVKGVMDGAEMFGADLIHGHLVRGDELRAWGEAGWRVVTTLHNTAQAWPRGVGELGAHAIALIVACSKAVEREVQLSIPVRTIWNGIEKRAGAATDWRRQEGVGDEDLILMALANVRPQKGFDLLGEIYAEVRKRLPAHRKCHLWMAGEGTERFEWPVGVEGKAFGCIGDSEGFLRAGDVLVCPSRHEGLSLVQLEALALGKRVVATRVGGAEEVEGLTLVEPGAGARVFAEAVIHALNVEAPGLRPSFTTAVMVERSAWLYRRVLAGGGDGAKVIWIVTNNLGVGGAQSSARRLAGEWMSRGIQVRVAVVEEHPDHPTVGRRMLLRGGIRVWCCARTGERDMGEVCEDLLREWDLDAPRAVLFWNLIVSCKLILADALLRTPVIDVSPGEMNFDSLSRYFERPRTGLPYRNAGEYGRMLAGAVVKYGAEKRRAEAELGCEVRVIPNGVVVGEEVDRSAWVAAAGVQFVTAARLSPDKRLEELLEAWRLAAEQLPRGSVLHIAGGVDGEKRNYAESLRGMAAGLPIRWHGAMEDVSVLYKECDVFVMISEPAGCPNASLEAMACGLPVIATDHGGASEQVVEGVTGFLTPRHDPERLAGRMVELAGNPELMRRMGRAAQERVKQTFSVQAMADAYWEMVEDYVRMPRTTLPETSVRR